MSDIIERLNKELSEEKARKNFFTKKLHLNDKKSYNALIGNNEIISEVEENNHKIITYKKNKEVFEAEKEAAIERTKASIAYFQFKETPIYKERDKYCNEKTFAEQRADFEAMLEKAGLTYHRETSIMSEATYYYFTSAYKNAEVKVRFAEHPCRQIRCSSHVYVTAKSITDFKETIKKIKLLRRKSRKELEGIKSDAAQRVIDGIYARKSAY